MATRDGPSVPRRKTTTYGKTSRKRPIHAFLDLTNGSRRAGDDSQVSLPPSTSPDRTRDPYDPPDDEPIYKSIPRRDASHIVAPSSLDSDAQRISKKRKLPATIVAKVERNVDGRPNAVASQSDLASYTRRAVKSPHMPGHQGSSHIARHESKPPATEKQKTTRQIDTPPFQSRATADGEILAKNTGKSQIRQVSMRTSKPESTVVRHTTTSVDNSIAKPKRPTEPRRMRLIDQLAAQNEDSTDSDSDTSDVTEPGASGTAASETLLSTPLKSLDSTMPKPSARPKVLPSTRKFKSTYGEQRTLRANDSGGDSLGNSMGIDGSQLELSPPPAVSNLSSFAFEEDEVEEQTSSKGGIIDIHALRQAGANHRFAENMADLIDRIGTPQPPKSQASRSRRSALLELASKLRDKAYVRQFRDQGAKDALFRAIGAEEDVISGFVLMSVLLVLFTSFSVPHLVPQLQSEGIAQLTSRMFDLGEDIASIAGQRKSSMSRNGQASVNTLKSTLQRLDVWKGSPPDVFSPRMLSLKVLAVLCKDSDGPATHDILAGLTDQLFSFAQRGWDTSRAQGMDKTEGGVALSLLEGYSIAAMQSEAGSRWTKRYLPILADILTAAMARPMDEFGEFESTTLKLALNTTNNNATAASAFSRGELFRELAETSLAAFELLEQSVRRGAFSRDIYEMLMLVLGVMINTSEYCPSTRQSVESWQGLDASPLDKLIEVYLENRESAVTADSVEKTSVAVAHGYLAILLGYLSLSAQVRRRLEEKSNGMGTKYLLDSIYGFMTLNAKINTDESTASLQNLVNELRRRQKTAV
ncbi:rheb small monomeric gtpase [Colletotrichum musicola]|uniref:Rheb small monomeric gtpase n=1 Tax=Colletotrichum musicola TaxID=2175873 RepID=A0A8H6U4P8_9PEZI|nr:rheb small monomeric gtpase [Colletotrichum musicola]